jgi:bacterioferritin-associated ferredoxin
MPARKAFVCLCEDVTTDELRSAIRRGYTDIEEIKRITGIGTGPCQGKQCLHILREILAQETGVNLDDIPMTTLRPPVVPIPIGRWVSVNEDRESE